MTTTAMALEGVTAALSQEAVERLGVNGPEWIQQRRLDAWGVYENTPMPTTKLEDWRYTNLRRLLDLDEMVLAKVGSNSVALPDAVVAAMEADRAASGHVVEIDGRIVHIDLDPALAEQGVVLMSIWDAVAGGGSVGELLERYLATQALPPEIGKFQALNAALWTDGVVLQVPKNVQLELPIRATRWASQSGAAYFSRALIIAEQHSQVSFVDEILSEDFEKQTLHSTAVELIAKDGAQAQYVSVQRMGKGAFYLSQQRTLANRDSTLDTLNVNLGSSIARVDLNAQLLGPGANSDMLGLYFGDTDQHFDHATSQDHIAPNTTSDLLYKGALDDSARAVFRGIIKVHPGAQRTDAYQTNRNLLLSSESQATSQPNLEIEADDVKCSHGATVGHLDDEALFYLMSRGLPRERAERLVVMGFLGEVMSRLPLGGVIEKVSDAIAKKLGRA